MNRTRETSSRRNLNSAKAPESAARKILARTTLRPDLGIILGSGFSSVLSRVETEAELSYGDLPGFPQPAVAGHSGRLIVGKLGGTPVLILSGRSHFYEGHDMPVVTFAVRVLSACGLKGLLLTNAAGGINRKFLAGDFMALSDHINLMGVNPLRGPQFGNLPRFVDMTQVYAPEMVKHLQRSGKAVGARVHRGIYLAVSGPSYETPAEIRAFGRLGADAVGMSTVPEAIVARQCGLRVAGLSCITNLAAGRSRNPLSHAEVLETAARVQETAGRLLENFAQRYAQQEK